ncbi:MAG: hypothetical protein QNK37_30435 [Acidobacteriota bacterium]|nr:hypothetical protein [Acidobacteriota bacterium]
MQILALVLLCLVHLFVGRLHFLHRGKSWLSFSGGAAAAYVFVYILPKLGYQQLILSGAAPAGGWLGYLQHHAYLVAFLGFLVYFGASRAGQCVEPVDRTPPEGLSHPLDILHILSVVLYALLVGYLVADYQRPGSAPIALATIALTMHFVGSDHVVAQRYGRLYDRFIRWSLVGATIAGACIGVLTTLRPTIVALWFAFLAGAIIIIVLEEELPEGDHGDFWWFFAGAVFFSVLILGVQMKSV